MYFAKAGHEGIGLYLRNVDYRFLDVTPNISFDTFFLACYVHSFCTILYTKNHISLDIKILRRSYKSIHGENLDIGLGNHLNPKRTKMYYLHDRLLF